LAGRAREAFERRVSRRVPRRVIEDEHWRLAAQLEEDALDAIGAAASDQSADLGRAGEAHEGDAGMYSDGGACVDTLVVHCVSVICCHRSRKLSASVNLSLPNP
jgi:hypothetical protein